jgi:hypothetical protein
VLRDGIPGDLIETGVWRGGAWFKDTLPDAPIRQLAVMRLDGDMYESTIQALDALYDQLSPGGFVIVDDYFLKPAPRRCTISATGAGSPIRSTTSTVKAGIGAVPPPRNCPAEAGPRS